MYSRRKTTTAGWSQTMTTWRMLYAWITFMVHTFTLYIVEHTFLIDAN